MTDKERFRIKWQMSRDFRHGFNEGRADAFNRIMPILIDIIDTEGSCYGHAEEIDNLENEWEQLKEK